MNTRIVSLLVVFMGSANLQAASESIIWQAGDNNLKNTMLVSCKIKKDLYQLLIKSRR